MNNFLRESRKLISSCISKRCCIIIGNESCDLDSAICSMSLAYYFNKNCNKIPNNPDVAYVIPMFNIKREEFPLKTEVVHFLKRNDINTANITFKDDMTETFITGNDVILVDHHLSKYSPIAVFDHRPFDPSSSLPKECSTVLEQIGSCATLIAEILLQDENPSEYKNILKLLHAPIVLDTVNFSKDAERAKEKDIEVCNKIELLLNISKEYRKEVFDELVEARADISSLNSYQVLFKDMKVISSKTVESAIVALPGFPILAQDYMMLPDAENSVKRFAEYHKCQIVVLIGMKVTDGILRRDLGLINISNQNLFNVIVDKVVNYDNYSMALEEYENLNFSNGKFFKQKNIRASRKQILPLVKSILDEL